MFEFPKTSICPIKSIGSVFFDVIFYIIVGFIIIYLISGFFDKNPKFVIDKCPLTNDKDQRLAILENNVDKIFEKLDHIWETINEGDLSESESEADDGLSEADEDDVLSEEDAKNFEKDVLSNIFESEPEKLSDDDTILPKDMKLPDMEKKE